MKHSIRIFAGLLAVLTLALCLIACSSGGKDGYYFQTNSGVKIVIGDTDEVVTAQLGTPISETSSASCGGFEGKDYVYTYKGFRVSTTPAKNGQIVCKIELTDDSVKTPEGVYIGMSRTDAEAAMKGKTGESVGGNLVYTADGVKLQIVFRDNSVAGILYVAQ
ncbi:MAG: hypothetical protein E7610_07800 [Ruminococcaceae bacterium]|nr:hypothetical protein [Oscillospiraceae bacterium]